MKMKTLFCLAAVVALFGCSSASKVDTSQTVYALGQAYVALAQIASSYVASPTADKTAVKDIRLASDAADKALGNAVTAVAACPMDPSTKKFDGTCANSSAVLSSVATAQTAITELEATLIKYNVQKGK